MALTPAEKQRAYRERQRAKERMQPESARPFLKQSFSSFVEEQAGLSDFELPLEISGIEPPTFFDERGPSEFVLNDVMQDVEKPFDGFDGAIGRAEVIIGSLIDAATELAHQVNRYKVSEIEARLAELQNPDNADRLTAIEDAVQLNKIKDQLSKQVRRSFPQWKVTGV